MFGKKGKEENSIKKYAIYLLPFFLTCVGVIIRILCRNFVSLDYSGFLGPWYDIIKSLGGMSGIDIQVGNYSVLYQFIIGLFTYVPIPPLFLYKGLSCVFDLVLAAAGGLIAYKLTKKGWAGVVAYGILFLSPLVWMNSSLWAQCDAIYVSLILLALLCLFKEKYVRTFIFVGLAFAIKLQTIFILPFLLFVWFAKRKFSIVYFGLVPLTMYLVNIPAFLLGRDVWSVFSVYIEQTGSYKQMYANYPGFWAVFVDDASAPEVYGILSKVAIALTVLALAMHMLYWFVRKVELNRENLLCMAFVLTYTTVFFLPAMHERYGYLYEVLAIVISVTTKRMIGGAIFLQVISLVTYSCYLFGTLYDVRLLAIFNCVIYVWYVIAFSKKVFIKGEK